ncbi:hypothetical protein AnigIFM59636_002183, partial [Aspergillus niger]
SLVKACGGQRLGMDPAVLMARDFKLPATVLQMARKHKLKMRGAARENEAVKQ